MKNAVLLQRPAITTNTEDKNLIHVALMDRAATSRACVMKWGCLQDY